ncbi:type VII secretion-associated serine protease mycosin [Dactylosporangium sp. NPDC048998]|uniref:type VII secretion-associated serine protease mycosin n=1 Tax=Dactylosporangium sp. NPDC048998 TaxID=3363976 RepID=UPI00371E733C
MVLLVTVRPAAADNIRDQQWHLTALGIPQAQKISQGDGVVVAVLDTGVEAKHAELAGAVLPGKGFGEGNDTDGRFDFLGHGTAMAGLIAGRGLPNGGGVLGVAPKAMILPLQVLRNEFGLGAPATFAEGIDWAVDHGAKVINLSVDTSEDPQVREAVERALRSDVVVVAAAGNTPDQTKVGFPANLPGVVAVGGTDRNGDHAAVSVTGPELVVVAPAVDVVSTRPSGQYALGTGTSDSTAIVAGVVALVRAKFPRLSGAEVVRRITATATDKGKPGRDDEYGFGIVNPVAALTADVPSAAAAPSGGGSGAGGAGAPPVGGGGAVKAVLLVGGVVVLVGGLVIAVRRWRLPRD